MSDIKLDFQDFAPSSSISGDPNQRPTLTKGRQSSEQPQEIISNKPEASDKYQSNISGIKEPHFSGETIRKLIGTANILGTNSQTSRKPTIEGGWGLSYLSQYFDITTSDVLQRIIWSIVPFRKGGVKLDDSLGEDELFTRLNPEVASDEKAQFMSSQTSYSYIERFIQSRPDLFGPTWISITLAFAVVVFSNFVSFTAYQSKFANKLDPINLMNSAQSDKFASEELDRWHYSLEQLNQATSLVIFHVLVVPTILWIIFWLRGCTKYYTITETVCAYGYSLSIFVPLTALLVYQSIWFRYTLILIASGLSGSALTLSFLPIVKSDPNPTSSHLILIIVPLCQLTFAYILHRIMLQ